jgi:hypothetical protein
VPRRDLAARFRRSRARPRILGEVFQRDRCRFVAYRQLLGELGPKTPVVSKGSQSTRACTLKEEPAGVVINANTGQPFTYKDPCVQTDPHIGYNEAASIATRKAVTELLRTAFKLD